MKHGAKYEGWMTMDKKLLNKNRCNIFNYIIENPGKHFSDIMRALGMTKRGLGYHMERLVEEGLIMVVPHGIFKFYYPPGADIPQHLTPMQQEILDLIQRDPCTVGEIADVLEKTKKAIDYHVGNLAGMGLIGNNDEGNLFMKK